MLLWLGVTAAALVGGFVLSRNFVRRRLRYVDAIQKPSAPLIAGAAAAAVVLPIAALPIITVGTAVAFGWAPRWRSGSVWRAESRAGDRSRLRTPAPASRPAAPSRGGPR